MKFKSIFTLLPVVFLFTLCNTSKDEKPKIQAIRFKIYDEHIPSSHTYIDSVYYHYGNYGKIIDSSWFYYITLYGDSIPGQITKSIDTHPESLLRSAFSEDLVYDSTFQTIKDTNIISYNLVYDSPFQVEKDTNIISHEFKWKRGLDSVKAVKLFYKDNLIVKEQIIWGISNGKDTTFNIYYQYEFDQYDNWTKKTHINHNKRKSTIVERKIYYK